MIVTVSLPDEILLQDSDEVSRSVLEQVALDGFKSGQLTTAQVRRILGFESRLEPMTFRRRTAFPGLIIQSRMPSASARCSKRFCLDDRRLRHHSA